MRKYYTRQGKVLANDSALLAHSLIQTPVANEDEISHSLTIVHSRKQRHSCNMVVANKQINPFLHTSVGLRQDFHSPPKKQGLTIVHITLT